MPEVMTADWLKPEIIHNALENAKKEDATRVREILEKSKEMKGLTFPEVAVLMNIDDKELTQELYDAAKYVKDEIYGRRIVFFAPLYLTNLCANECIYCAFRKSNKDLVRHALTTEEIIQETEILIDQGHKRVLLVAGESYPKGIDYVLDAIDTIYSVKKDNGSIRRMNVNLAPLIVENFKLIHEKGIGTYQLFQETYDRDVYAKVHLRGKKADFDWRATAIDRAMEAGIDDVGIGVLLGLADWRFDIMAMIQHAEHLENKFGVGCHTISVPRIEPAYKSEYASDPSNPVSDEDFKKLVAILRLAVPYTGIIMSTRETAKMRRETLSLGVSQISAGSRTNPGGYASDPESILAQSQFQLGDHRVLEEVVNDLAEMGYIPSFCTACYRLGRTGDDFMELAKAGLIKKRCAPNAVGTFMEFLEDYASEETRIAGEKAIEEEISRMEPKEQHVSNKICGKIKKGKRDVYC
ncbi:MAG: [FeFe] hydrogenase H-cluster radical SAM maturase HydG [Alphaproteobacteria bacterium]